MKNLRGKIEAWSPFVIIAIVIAYGSFLVRLNKDELARRGIWIERQMMLQVKDDKTREVVNSLVVDRFTGEDGKRLEKRIKKLEEMLQQKGPQDK